MTSEAWIEAFRFKHSLSCPDAANMADRGGVPGCLFPFGVLALPEADLVQLGEQSVGDVLLVTVLCPQQELHPLSWCVCCSRQKSMTETGLAWTQVQVWVYLGTYCARGILSHHQLWSPSPWTSSCVCVRGDGGVCVTSCPRGREPRCRECGDLETKRSR